MSSSRPTGITLRLLRGILRSHAFISLRKYRNYRLYFVGQIISVCGTWMQDTALPWLVLQRTSSPVAVGALLFCRYMPFTLFSLTAGLTADLFDNRRVLILTQTSSMIIAVALSVLAYTTKPSLTEIFGLAFLGGASVVFDNPSRQGLTFQLVGRRELPNAVALNSSLQNAGRLVGPAFAGVVIAAVGIGACFVINAVTFLAMLAALVMMDTAKLFPVSRAEADHRSLNTRAIREGMRHVAHDRSLRLILILLAVGGVFGFNLRVLLPILASTTLQLSATGFGALYAAFGAGAVLGALLAAGLRVPTWAELLASLGVLSAAMVILAPIGSVWVAAVLLVAIGAAFTVWTATSQSMLQLSSPDGLRGRVMGLYIFVFGGLIPVGSLLSGWLAARGGTMFAFALSGSAGLLATAGAAAELSRSS